MGHFALVPVTITAVDAEGVVTAVGGPVNGVAFLVEPIAPAHSVEATGKFVAQGIGAYQLAASATSAGGIGNSPVVGVGVNYAMSWLPPLSLGRTIKGAVPIKFAARDCQGGFVADSSIRVEVWEAGQPRKTFVLGDGADAVRIDTDAEHYIANFKPSNGSHTYTVGVFFNGYLQASTTFVTQ